MATNYFKSRREACRLTQQQVADALGVTSASVSAWERGVAVPQVRMLTQMAALYRTSVAQLVKAIDKSERPRQAVTV